MDQTAFRQLLSTPRSNVASSEPSSSIPGAARHFGKVKKRDGLQSSPATSNLLPRRFERSVKSDGAVADKVKEPLVNSVTGEEYVDRAAARRLAEDDVDEIEERRKRLEEQLDEASDEEARAQIKRQIRSLDEGQRQSAVKKGLDLQLLAKQKAKLNRGGQSDEIVDDDDLEVAYGAGKSVDKEENNDVKRENPVPSKFKPIGSTSKLVKEAEEDKPEYIWRDGKRLRKKKKVPQKNQSIDVAPPDARFQGPPTQMPVQTERVEPPPLASPVRAATSHKKTEKEPQMLHEPPIATLIPVVGATSEEEAERQDKAESTDDEDEGGDIFADAGRWRGLDESDAEDGEGGQTEISEASALAVTVPLAPSGKKDWFATGAQDTTHDERLEARLPGDLLNIVKGAEKAKEAHASLSNDQRSETGGESDEEKEVRPPKAQRLEGFSDSILGRKGVRYMLEKKDDDGPDRKRRRKRSKKGKGGYGSD